MKLFLWTLHQYDACDHHAAFADAEEEALEAIRVQMREDWKLPPDDPSYHTEDYLEHREKCLAETYAAVIALGSGWVLTEHEIKRGGLSL